MPLISIRMGEVISFFYTNHRGERSRRRVKPVEVRYGSVPDYYPEPTWLLSCWDEDKQAQRDFDFSKIEMDDFEKERW